MIRYALASILLVLAWLGSVAPARAQFSQYLFPIEPATLQRNLEFQLQYSNALLAFGQDENHGVDADHLILSIDGHYYFADRWEIGLNVPFLEVVKVSAEDISSDDERFGDIRLDLKARLFTLGPLTMALFLDTYLPTHSGEQDRNYATLLPGVAATLRFAGLTVGGSAKTLAWVDGDAEDGTFFGFDAYGGYTLFGLLTPQLAFEYYQSFEHGEFSAVALTPGIEIGLLRILRAGVASRIALNDDGKYFFGGRASLLFHAGIAF